MSFLPLRRIDQLVCGLQHIALPNRYACK
jgi:hypothetical protein